MFSWNDLVTFCWAFFIVLPLTSFVHATGHTFFVVLFGGKPVMTMGRGRKLFSLGTFHVHSLYFIDASCQYDKIKKEARWKYALIYAGGVIFNALSILVVNSLIHMGIWPKHLFFYQFVYFSVYFIFFALLPIEYGKDNPSDGKALYTLLKSGKKIKEYE
ncbi:hypothetical protein D1B31_09555 [Neobacillus notoginsengisoli]|uniref:Integral inner membrane protein n=1 Tax=Neobacillus notoginsengisoli TaxID=1578198 RepID=A0A417YV45_9BACI|nr:hypothetical protein [Neobacillus notoginsengisoli]RHW41171.1 hypothetical protein D1B31_09555 [Neobacillus notoginsengisoli]